MKLPLNLTKYARAYEIAKRESGGGIPEYDAILSVYETRLGGTSTEVPKGTISDVQKPFLSYTQDPVKPKKIKQAKKVGTTVKKRKK